MVDTLLMILGFVGAVGDGFAIPAFFMFACVIFNDMGQGSIEAVNKNVIYLVYLAGGSFLVLFMEGYCWSRTGEQQASRMRVRYLTAVLRQDVEYFDLNVGTSSEVITNITSDKLVIQDCLSEKVPNFIMNCATFVGCYAGGFSMTWRLPLVGSPTAVLLVIPGILYGRILMELARKMRREYQKEERTIAKFSATLDDSVKLGLYQGLMKGLAVDSNGIIFAIMAFLVWFGSRIVMYNGGKGGTVFAVSNSIIFGGLALGSRLSNLKYFSEAISTGEHILEVIRRVPKIDSGISNGEVLENLSGDVELETWRRTVALVGGSGSGKSTVIALLELFANEILLDGTNIKRLQLKWLRSQIGLVSQEPALFATSIKENILFGKKDATMEEVVAAAMAANAHSFISLLPQGYDTKISDGAALSRRDDNTMVGRNIVIEAHLVHLPAIEIRSGGTVPESMDGDGWARSHEKGTKGIKIEREMELTKGARSLKD
ncbi:hypothetical protein ZIOFF_068658 [Zingiber officinale]|uniref:ABC transmembrane type-1 domain-containing protein n=1 Tax=Zingiber officinale TaxID=94328 RepID=A0A8J5CEV7_ZINOF|nr:hypothetical protein ZIOFF_068658 [Zingiber officinale]